ncbi:alpha-L-fucosidase [Pedobacter aquatilis]|uniref:alpha-L-fucosidase n=1 Tax=Pedobacter aquatilis TaxID=351343 RepID=UPI0029307C52|nr:alpha-L-fucosidase [Pedobacter aquatilis]
MANENRLREQKLIDSARKNWWDQSMDNLASRIAWWREAKLGLFIHWGIYSLPGGEWQGKKVTGYSEHLMRKEKISREDYLKIAHEFNPGRFNADDWVKSAKAAGARYLIITAKHHDGFAMYDSKVSKFNVINETAWKKDPMIALSKACKRYGLKFGFYYSHAFDWENPDAPGNDWSYQNPGGDLGLFGGRNWYDVHPELIAKAAKYVDEKAIPQIKELLTIYKPDILWFDTPHKLPLSENLRILKVIRETDDNVVINGRLLNTEMLNMGDYKNTADRPAEFYPVSGDWEAIPTTNESYGYAKFDKSHKPVGHFIRLLAKAASKGGNLLLNIGAMGSGEFAEADKHILEGLGNWMAKNSASIYGTSRTPLPIQNWGVITQKDKLLYLHVFNWPKDNKLILSGLKSKFSKAYFLTAPSKTIKTKRIDSAGVQLDLPKAPLDTLNTVIVLETSDPIQTDPIPSLASNQDNVLLSYDARLSGGGFGYGDGKAGRYYVTGWKNKSQQMRWDFKALSPVKFTLKIKYLSDAASAGTYTISIDKFKKIKTVISTTNEQIQLETIGDIDLSPGLHNLEITPVTITKQELIKVLEIQLIPYPVQ